MTIEKGVGDRWLHGERLPGVDFAQYDRVTITEGGRAGRTGAVLLLVTLEPEPMYLVAIDGEATSNATGSGPAVRVRQGSLRAAS